MIKSISCTILKNKNIATDMYMMTVDSSAIASIAEPGQFVHLKIPEDQSMLLRRPISIHYANVDTGEVELVYQLIGKGTYKLATLAPGSSIDILGPLGKGFKIDEHAKKIYLVGGGCGIAPLKFIPAKWPNADYYTFLGYRTKDAAYELDTFSAVSKALFISTNDGSLGKKEFVTDRIIEEIPKVKPDLIFACGPTPMMKIIKNIAHKYSIPCQLSLEEKMGCGIGGCLVCSCAIGKKEDWQYRRVCADGPVFSSQEVLFDE